MNVKLKKGRAFDGEDGVRYFVPAGTPGFAEGWDQDDGQVMVWVIWSHSIKRHKDGACLSGRSMGWEDSVPADDIEFDPNGDKHDT